MYFVISVQQVQKKNKKMLTLPEQCCPVSCAFCKVISNSFISLIQFTSVNYSLPPVCYGEEERGCSIFLIHFTSEGDTAAPLYSIMSENCHPKTGSMLHAESPGESA